MNYYTLPDWEIFRKLPGGMSKDVTAFHVFGIKGDQMIVCTGSKEDAKVFVGSGNDLAELKGLRGNSLSNAVTSQSGAILLLTSGGQLYALGNNDYGQVGNYKSGRQIAHINAPVKEPFKSSMLQDVVVKIAIGPHQCACVTEFGDLYTWGYAHASSDREKKLGHSGNCCVPNKAVRANTMRGNSKFIQVACMENSVYALDNQGRVYSTYSDRFLSFGDEQIVEISCSSAHMLALSRNDSVFAWGRNTEHQLGLDIADNHVEDPKRLTVFDQPYVRIVSVLAFKTMSLALSHEGIPYVWGQTRLPSKMQPYLEQTKGMVTNLREQLKLTKESKQPGLFGPSVKLGALWDSEAESSLKETCINRVPLPASAFAKGSLLAALQEEIVGPMVTPCLIQIDINNKNRLKTDAFDEQFNDAKTSDFQINVNGQLIHAHKAVLLKRSAHFRTMLLTDGDKGGWREGCQNVLEIKDFTYLAYRAFIFYLYKGYIPEGLSMEEAFSLTEIADMYFVEKLRTAAYDYALARWFNANDIFELYCFAKKTKAEMILNRCKYLIVQPQHSKP